MNAADRSRFVYVTFIRTTPARLWEALTDPEIVSRYWFGTPSRAGGRRARPGK